MINPTFLHAVADSSALSEAKFPEFWIVTEDTIVLPSQCIFAPVREMVAFDLSRELFIARWDMSDGKNLWTVGFNIESKNELLEARNFAASVFRKSFQKNKVKANSLDKGFPTIRSSQSHRA